MNEQDIFSWKRFEQVRLSRRNLIRGMSGTAAAAGLLRPSLVFAEDGDDGEGHASCALANPIPGGVTPFKPFGVVVHHNPLNPAKAVKDINDPSQITDFEGFVGLTHIRGGGTGTNTNTGATTPLAYQADMGFSQGRFVGIDGRVHRGTLAFV